MTSHIWIATELRHSSDVVAALVRDAAIRREEQLEVDLMTPGTTKGNLLDVRLRLLSEAKGHQRLSVCIPARNEAMTIGPIVETIRRSLMDEISLIDEIVVMDHASTDPTAQIARAAGAYVVSADSVAPELGPAIGKGDVLWRSVIASDGDIIVWLDADLKSFSSEYVVGLLAPLLYEPALAMVRADYTRSLDGKPAEGGRVTELVARPMLKLLFPYLSHIRQPLGGEYAIRRQVAEALQFEVDYGVEIGLLIDVAERFGTHAITQVDLGHREHRNRPLSDLHDQAGQVMQAMIRRANPGQVQARIPPRPPARSFRQSRMHVVASRGRADDLPHVRPA